MRIPSGQAHYNTKMCIRDRPNLIERVCETILRNGTPYSKIKIEFTESAIADNPQVVSHFVDEMHQLGIRLGLDDFGVGYSNLDTVVHIPFDTIKLDKSLVWSATQQEKSAIMVRNITNTFLELGMKVLAAVSYTHLGSADGKSVHKTAQIQPMRQPQPADSNSGPKR